MCSWWNMTLVRCLMPNSRVPLRTDTAPQSSFKILNFSLICKRKKKAMRWSQFFIRLILFLKKAKKNFFSSQKGKRGHFQHAGARPRRMATKKWTSIGGFCLDCGFLSCGVTGVNHYWHLSRVESVRQNVLTNHFASLTSQIIPDAQVLAFGVHWSDDSRSSTSSFITH